MSIPDTPQTREEMYLNAAATGNTSGIPAQPYTRKEMYLDAIARNGGGGGSGGGSGGGGVLVVNLTLDEDTGNLVFDKTWSEVSAASAAVAYFDMSAFGGRGSFRYLIGNTDAVGNGDGSFTYRVLTMIPGDGSDGFTVDCVPFTTNSTDGYPSMQSE